MRGSTERCAAVALPQIGLNVRGLGVVGKNFVKPYGCLWARLRFLKWREHRFAKLVTFLPLRAEFATKQLMFAICICLFCLVLRPSLNKFENQQSQVFCHLIVRACWQKKPSFRPQRQVNKFCLYLHLPVVSLHCFEKTLPRIFLKCANTITVTPNLKKRTFRPIPYILWFLLFTQSKQNHFGKLPRGGAPFRHFFAAMFKNRKIAANKLRKTRQHFR